MIVFGQWPLNNDDKFIGSLVWYKQTDFFMLVVNLVLIELNRSRGADNKPLVYGENSVSASL